MKRLPVGAVNLAASDICKAVLVGGWKFRKVLGGGGFELKRVGITSSISF